MKQAKRLSALLRNVCNRRGPTCGRRFFVNSLFHAADIFYGTLLETHDTWIGKPKWQGRYKALKRSRIVHGHSTEIIELLDKVMKEWNAVVKLPCHKEAAKL